MDKILTLIIPTYNMEKYLLYCLDSLIVNGEGLDMLEVLVINDGSRDCSLEIARGYEREYPRTFRVIDKENGNYGSCVNRGLAEATGKYVKVLDADDSFDTENFSLFLDFLQKTDADLILSDFAVVDSERNVRKIIRYDLGHGVSFDMDDVCTGHVFKNMQMHAVTYRLENLKSMGYRQTEGISYTDQQWIFIPMVSVKAVARFGKPVYEYLVGRAGQTVDPSVKVKSIGQTVQCALDMAGTYERYRSKVEGRPVKEYLFARITPLLKDVYVYSLTHYDSMMKALVCGLDEALAKTSAEIYEYIGSPRVSSFMGFEYIDYWRHHKNINAGIVKIMSMAYMFVLKLKKSGTGNDPMSVPTSFE